MQEFKGREEKITIDPNGQLTYFTKIPNARGGQLFSVVAGDVFIPGSLP